MKLEPGTEFGQTEVVAREATGPTSSYRGTGLDVVQGTMVVLYQGTLVDLDRANELFLSQETNLGLSQGLAAAACPAT